MNYVYIENNVIKEGPTPLPRSWRNVSGLNYMTDSELISIGWMPVRVELGEVKEVFEGSTFQILTNEVLEIKKWRDKTQQEKDADLEAKKKMLRAERDKKLNDSDWVVIKAVELGRPVESNWAIYRQALRDVPSQQGFPISVIWPVQPSS